MNSTSLFLAVIQETAEQRRNGIIGSILVVLAFVGLMFFFYRFPPQDTPIDAKPDDALNQTLESPVANQSDGCIAGCIGSLIKLSIFLFILVGLLFLIVKAVKFVWFF
jgi:hypothetical protein